jgi:hypothetical protein
MKQGLLPTANGIFHDIFWRGMKTTRGGMMQLQQRSGIIL